MGKGLSIAAGLLFFGCGNVLGKELGDWRNVRAVLNNAVVVEMKTLPQLGQADMQLGRYGDTVIFEGEILEVGNSGVILKITHIAGKPVSCDVHMLSFLLGPSVQIVTGKTKEVLYAVAPILKPDVVRIMKKNNTRKRWYMFGVTPKEKAVYCPLPKSDLPRTRNDSSGIEPMQNIYVTIE